MTPVRTAILLPHRERFTHVGAGAIALTVAGQLAEGADVGSEGGAIEIWGDTLSGPPLIPPERCGYRPLRLSRWLPGRRSWRYRLAVERMIRRRAPHRLEIHNRAQLFHRLARLPMGLALYLHNDPWSIRGLKSAAERQAVARRADYVVCVSDFLRQRFCADLPAADCAKVCVVPNTVDVERLQPVAEKRNEILFVGRLIPEKGALPLIEALGRILPRHPGWSARMIGAWHFGQSAPRYPHEHEIRAAAAQVGAALKLEGYRTFDHVVDAFARAAIVVVPSLWQEPFGRTALEAMAAGCAVIASDNGGLPEVVGDAGLLVPPEPSALAEALERLVDDPGRRMQLGRAAMVRAREVFAPAAVHARIRALRLG